jgi:hypothetical protein
LKGSRFPFVAAGQGGLQILRPEVGEALLVLAGQDLDAGSSVSAALSVTPEPTSDPRASSTPIIQVHRNPHIIDEPLPHQKTYSGNELIG